MACVARWLAARARCRGSSLPGPGTSRERGVARVGDPDKDVRALALEGISSVVPRGDHDTGGRGATRSVCMAWCWLEKQEGALSSPRCRQLPCGIGSWRQELIFKIGTIHSTMPSTFCADCGATAARCRRCWALKVEKARKMAAFSFGLKRPACPRLVLARMEATRLAGGWSCCLSADLYGTFHGLADP